MRRPRFCFHRGATVGLPPARGRHESARRGRWWPWRRRILEFSPGSRRGSIARPWEGELFMKLTTRKDKPFEPIVSTSECWAGLKLVCHILGRIVESGNAPEQVVERSHEFGVYLETLMQERKVFPNSKDLASLNAVILAGELPTLRSSQRANAPTHWGEFWTPAGRCLTPRRNRGQHRRTRPSSREPRKKN